MGCDWGSINHDDNPECFYSPQGGKQFNVYDRPSLRVRRQVAVVAMRHARDPNIVVVKKRWVKPLKGSRYVCVCKIVYKGVGVIDPTGVWCDRTELERLGIDLT